MTLPSRTPSPLKTILLASTLLLTPALAWAADGTVATNVQANVAPHTDRGPPPDGKRPPPPPKDGTRPPPPPHDGNRPPPPPAGKGAAMPAEEEDVH